MLPLLLAVFAVGTTLRFLHLGTKSLWLDEAVSVMLARARWPDLVRTLTTEEPNMAAYYLALRGWVHFGSSEATVRSLSAVAAVATLPGLYAAGAQLFGTRVGLVGATLLTVNAFHVKYAQEARAYSLFVLFVTLSLFFFARAIERPSRAAWIGYVVTATLAIYSHFFGALAVAGQWASLAWLRRCNVPWRSLAASGAVIAVLLLPRIAFFLTATGRLTNIDWIREPTLADVWWLSRALVGAASIGEPERVFVGLSALCVVMAFTGAISAWRRGGASFPLWHHALLFMSFLLPIAVALCVSVVKPVFIDKYLIECLPLLLLLIAVGVCRIRPIWLSTAVLAGLIGLSTLGVFAYYEHDQKEDWRGATHYVLSEARSGDAAIFYRPYVQTAFDYYRERQGGVVTVPAVVHPTEAGRPDGALGRAAPHFERVWLILSSDDNTGGFIQESLARNFPSLCERRFTDIRVLLYTRERCESGTT